MWSWRRLPTRVISLIIETKMFRDLSQIHFHGNSLGTGQNIWPKKKKKELLQRRKQSPTVEIIKTKWYWSYITYNKVLYAGPYTGERYEAFISHSLAHNPLRTGELQAQRVYTPVFVSAGTPTQAEEDFSPSNPPVYKRSHFPEPLWTSSPSIYSLHGTHST